MTARIRTHVGPDRRARWRVRLNPQGRRQNNKRRATVAITPTLATELATWERDNERVITYYGKPLATSEFFDLLAETAGVTGGSNVIRHTVPTWLAEVGACSWATRAKEAPRARVTSIAGRPYAGWELSDQPDPAELLRVNCVASEVTAFNRRSAPLEALSSVPAPSPKRAFRCNRSVGSSRGGSTGHS
jgi:hypothetical protein